MWNYIANSTLKREAASVLMLWYLVVTTKVIWYAPFDVAERMIGDLTYPIGFIFAGAFSLDWVSKQTTIAGPPMLRKDGDGFPNGERRPDGT